jgi:hypothetical protein
MYTLEQTVYYTLRKGQKTQFLIDYAYTFRKSMQTGQQRFRDGSLRPEETEFFWKYMMGRKWCSELDLPPDLQTQPSLFSTEELYAVRKQPERPV